MSGRPKAQSKAQSKGKPRRPTTRLWYVCLAVDPAGPVVLVSANPVARPCVESRRIRAITANAAGRRYARNDVETAVAGLHFETDNPASADYRGLTREMVKQFKGKGRNTPVRVIT